MNNTILNEEERDILRSIVEKYKINRELTEKEKQLLVKLGGKND